MKKSMLSLTTAAALLVGVGLASAATTTTTWTNDQGVVMRQYSTTNNYSSFNDPSMKPTVGMELPASVTLYPLPQTMNVQSGEQYRYTMINNNPVVVDSTTRKVIHTWNPAPSGSDGGGSGK